MVNSKFYLVMDLIWWVCSKMKFQQKDLFGGKGVVDIHSLLQGQAAPFSAALHCELEEGGFVGKHRQQRDPELIIGISGEGIVTVNDVENILREKSTVYVPFGAVLSIQNLSDKDSLQYLIIKAQVL